MATNPPVTIGPFTNVPAPGSGVKSDWPQQISQYVTDHASELFYGQIVADIALTAVTAATAHSIIPGAAVTYQAKPIMLEFFSQQIQLPNNGAQAGISIGLFDGNTDIGYLGQFVTPVAGVMLVSTTLRRRLTPTAGAHTYNVRAWITGTTGAKIGAGPGGAAGVVAPAYLRVTGA